MQPTSQPRVKETHACERQCVHRLAVADCTIGTNVEDGGLRRLKRIWQCMMQNRQQCYQQQRQCMNVSPIQEHRESCSCAEDAITCFQKPG